MPTFSIRNPYLIVVCALMLCLVGVTVLTRMPVDMFPKLDLTAVVTATLYPGMPPEQVEKNITERQERFFTLAPGIEHIESRSMTGAGILEGDLVVVRPQETAQDGDIVVALVGEEATVKRFFRENDHIRLQPENDHMEPIRTREVQIVGKVVGLLRVIT